jgi:hypothetical protein
MLESKVVPQRTVAAAAYNETLSRDSRRQKWLQHTKQIATQRFWPTAHAIEGRGKCVYWSTVLTSWYSPDEATSKHQYEFYDTLNNLQVHNVTYKKLLSSHYGNLRANTKVTYTNDTCSLVELGEINRTSSVCTGCLPPCSCDEWARINIS